jgi:hypothetical protein
MKSKIKDYSCNGTEEKKKKIESKEKAKTFGQKMLRPGEDIGHKVLFLFDKDKGKIIEKFFPFS